MLLQLCTHCHNPLEKYKRPRKDIALVCLVCRKKKYYKYQRALLLKKQHERQTITTR